VLVLRFIGWLGRNVLVPYLPLFIATLLAADAALNTATGLTIALASGAGTVSALVLGRMSDRVGHRRVLLVCALAAAVFYIPQAWVSAVWQLMVLQMLTGAAAGGIMPVLSALLNSYTTPGEEGAAYGFDNSVVSLSRAVAPMAGAALVFWWGFPAIFIASGLLFALTALIGFWLLPRPKPQTEIKNTGLG
jgi:MFS transporter, DHA1 family, multidrug resistance protein